MYICIHICLYIYICMYVCIVKNRRKVDDTHNRACGTGKRAHDRFHLKCYTPEIHQIAKLKFLSAHSNQTKS